VNLFFKMALAPYDFAAGQRHYILGQLEGLGHENLDFFGPKQLSLRSSCFRAQKSLDFHAPTLPIARVMSLPCIKIITSRAI